MTARAIVSLTLLCAACGPGPTTPVCPDVPPAATALLDPARLLAFDDGEGMRVDGRAGAVSAGATVTLGGVSGTADEAGAFSLEGAALEGIFEVSHADATTTLPLTARSVDDALACTVGMPIETGTLPNDLVMVTCDGASHVAVVLSAEGAIDVFDATGARRDMRPTFPVKGGAGAEPFSLTLVDDGPRAVVTLFGQHALALVDLCAGVVLDTAEVRDDAGVLTRLTLDESITLALPVDADLDGTDETVVTRYAPRHPQGVAVIGERAFVTFTNHLEPATPTADQVLAPGTLARFRVDGDELVPDGHLVLTDAKNPQAVVTTPLGLLVSLSGSFARGSATAVADDGALLFVDADSLIATHRIDVGPFAPARPAYASGRIVVGSLLRSTILVIAPDAASSDEGRTLTVPGDATESLFDAAPIGDDLVLVTSFTRDRLHIVDVRDESVSAWPFEDGVPLVEPSGLFRGALALDVTRGAPGRATGVVLLGLSSEVVWLNFSGVFGP
jgi:hypothetical protein